MGERNEKRKRVFVFDFFLLETNKQIQISLSNLKHHQYKQIRIRKTPKNTQVVRFSDLFSRVLIGVSLFKLKKEKKKQ